MLRIILAVLLGWFAGGGFNMAVVTLSHSVYPLPDGIDPNDFEAFRAHVQANGMPTGALLMVLVAHAGGSFVSGFVCGLIAGRPWYLAAAFLGVFWTCGGIAMLMMLPAPTWFAIADVLLYAPAALLGVKLGGTLTRTPSPKWFPKDGSAYVFSAVAAILISCWTAQWRRLVCFIRPLPALPAGEEGFTAFLRWRDVGCCGRPSRKRRPYLLRTVLILRLRY